MKRYECKFGLPHDYEMIKDFADCQYEVCKICNKKTKWRKGHLGRIDNKRYLEEHARDTAQPGGRTNELFMRIYHREKCLISL